MIKTEQSCQLEIRRLLLHYEKRLVELEEKVCDLEEYIEVLESALNSVKLELREALC